MIYAYDRSIQMPVKDLYDTQIMGMAISAAKDMYDKGQKQIDDFYKLYGDFTTPIEKDMQWYNNNVVGRMQKEINDLYASGIDPLRSAEGRAAISRLANSIPIGTISAMRANAANYEKFLQAKADLESKGLYDPELDAFTAKYYGLPTEKDFSTVADNGGLRSWTRLSPTEYSTLNELVTPLVKDLKEGLLTKQEVESYGDPNLKYDPRYKYTGRSEQMVRKTLEDNMPGIVGDPRYQYYRMLSERKLRQQNPNADITKEDVDRQFMNDAFNAVSRFVTRPTPEADEYQKMQYQYDLQDRNNARTFWRERNNPKPSSSSGGGRGSTSGIYSYLAHALNAAVNLDNRTIVERQTAALREAKQNSKKTGSGTINAQDIINKMRVRDGSDAILQYYLNRKTNDGGTIDYIRQQDENRLRTAGEIMSDMRNIKVQDAVKNQFHQKANSIREEINKPYNDNGTNVYSTIIPTGNSVFYTDHNGVIHHYIEVETQYGNGKKQMMYMDSGAQYDALLRPTGNMSSAIAADQRASQQTANKANRTESLLDPTSYE